jgi:hypothetical protein
MSEKASLVSCCTPRLNPVLWMHNKSLAPASTTIIYKKQKADETHLPFAFIVLFSNSQRGEKNSSFHIQAFAEESYQDTPLLHLL